MMHEVVTGTSSCIVSHRFLRLPFGLVCAQDVFQRKVDETFGDLPGVTGIADDIVVVGYKEDGSDHDANLRQVLDRARSTGLCLNADKLIVKCTRIQFCGHVIGAKGLEPDPSKVDAVRLFVCWSLTSLCHSNGHIETMPAREINPFTALTRIRSQFLRTQ